MRRAARDPGAFDEVYEALGGRVLVFFTRRVFDAQLALDLTGETFAIAWQERHRFRGTSREEEEEGWIFAIARSQLSRYWRRGRVERAALERLGVDVPSLPDVELERIEDLAGTLRLRQLIADELERLPVDQRRLPRRP